MKINEVISSKGLVGKTLYGQSQDIGSFYVHDEPSRSKRIPKIAVEPIAVDKGTRSQPEVPTELPSTDSEKSQRVTPKFTPKAKTTVQKTVITKSGEKITKGSDGFWRTQDNKIIDMPELVNALEKLAAAPSGQASMQTTPTTPADIPSKRKRARNVT